MTAQNDNCIFCKIAKGEMPAHKVWEDENYLAFLSIFPNTEGFTVVIPKKHYSSYAFAQSDEILSNLILAAKKVARKIDNAFEDVGRTGLILEGFGVDHLHAKLFPMHSTSAESWQPVESDIDIYFEKYLGYISSHDSSRADDEALAVTAKKIRQAKGN